MSRRFRVDPLPSDQPRTLEPAAAHHLLHVMRLGPGASVTAYDGHGYQVAAMVERVEGSTVWLQATAERTRAAPLHRSHLVLALLKPKAMDLALRMAVEVGITDLHLFQAARSQGRPPRLDRWSRITDAAAQQCGRADLPALHWHDSTEQALQAVLPVPVWIALPDAPDLEGLSGEAAMLVGPEGGFTEAEVQHALTLGAQPAGLGSWVLRADTAAVLAAQALRPR